MTRPLLPEAENGASGDKWLGMRDACTLLGVSESTLRSWSNGGQVRAFLTPGGHRRFRETDIRALMSREAAPAGRERDGETLTSALLGSRERFELVARRAWGDTTWYRALDDESRRQFRVLGISLLGLLGEYVGAGARRDRDRSLARGEEVALQYGAYSAGLGLSLVEATEAFVVFRGPVLDVAQQWLSRQSEPTAMMSETLGRVNQFMDNVLVTMFREHEGAIRRRAEAAHA
ncbi:MAG: helix-turn-helix domain-containing protein [Chloroflexota bacterium]